MTKEDLQQVRKLHRDITSLRAAKVRLGELYQSVSTEAERTSLGQTLAKIEERIAAAIESSLAMESKIVSEMLLLPPQPRAIMFDRFVNGKSVEQVAKDHCLSKSSINRIIRDGIAYINTIT